MKWLLENGFSREDVAHEMVIALNLLDLHRTQFFKATLTALTAFAALAAPATLTALSALAAFTLPASLLALLFVLDGEVPSDERATRHLGDPPDLRTCICARPRSGESGHAGGQEDVESDNLEETHCGASALWRE